MLVSLTGTTLYTQAWVIRNIDQKHVPLERWTSNGQDNHPEVVGEARRRSEAGEAVTVEARAQDSR